MSYHRGKEVNSAIIRLLDALCQWERDTGNCSTLLIIPHNIDENLVIAENGKPVWGEDINPHIRLATNARYNFQENELEEKKDET